MDFAGKQRMNSFSQHMFVESFYVPGIVLGTGENQWTNLFLSRVHSDGGVWQKINTVPQSCISRDEIEKALKTKLCFLVGLIWTDLAKQPDLNECETIEYIPIPISENTHTFDSRNLNGCDCRMLPLNHTGGGVIWYMVYTPCSFLKFERLRIANHIWPQVFW